MLSRCTSVIDWCCLFKSNWGGVLGLRFADTDNELGPAREFVITEYSEISVLKDILGPTNLSIVERLSTLWRCKNVSPP